MIEAAMIWNEPNNKSHWDVTVDPEWTMFGDLVVRAGGAIHAINPAITRVLGGMSPIDPHWLRRMEAYGALDAVDAVAVHGFPLDWNLWPLNAWPDKIAEIKAVTDKPVWVTEVGVGSFGAEEVQTFGIDRTAELLIGRVPRIFWYSLYDLPMAWGAETRHREAEGSSYYRHFYMGLIREDGTPKPALDHYARHADRMGLMQWFHFEDPRLDDAVAWMKRLGVRHLRTGLSWADSFRPDAIDWFDRQMAALEDFDVTVTFCFTPEHLGVAQHHTSAPADPQGFADFCAWMIDRYAPAAVAAPDRRHGDRMSMAPPDAGHRIRLAIVGVGNCASSLVQGIAHYRDGANDLSGLMHLELGGYRPGDIDVVAAWDIDRRKVGQDVARAIFAKPNCTAIFCPQVPDSGTEVGMGRVLDGIAEHMGDAVDDRTFLRADAAEPDRAAVVATLRATRADVLINYLPVGSQAATEFYAECALEAGVAFVNAIPVFIASDPAWAVRFAAAGVPIIGDDIKAQLGATIVHRVLTDLFAKRGVTVDRTYQLNTGGNTDFLNMSNRTRLASKKVSKTEAVQAVASERIADENIHVGPSDYVAWQNDNKVAFIRMEGQLFGGVPMHLEMRLSVEDSPNSAGVAIDMIRCAKLALDRGIGGPIHAPSTYFCKHPPEQTTDDLAHAAVEAFIADGVAG